MSRRDWEERPYRLPRDEKPAMNLGGLLLGLALSAAFWGFLLWALWP